MLFNNIEPNGRLTFIIIVLIIAIEFVALTGGFILEIKERYCYRRRTKKYLYGEYEGLLQREYPGWEIAANVKNIGKKELRKKCAECILNLSQRPLYPAGTLTKAFGSCSVSVRIFVAVKPSYYEENRASADTYEPTEYYTWLFFDVKPIYQEKLKMSGHFYAESFNPLPGTQDTSNSLGQHMSYKKGRKIDITTNVHGWVRIDNKVTLSYLGIPQNKWQNAVTLGLQNEIDRLFSAWGLKMKLDYSKGKLTLAAWIKMPDGEMYNGHNDFAIANSEPISYVAEKLSVIAEIVDKA